MIQSSSDSGQSQFHQKLKVALAVSARRVPLWVAATGDALAAVDFIDLRLIVIGEPSQELADESVPLRSARVWRLFTWIDGAARRLLLKDGPDPSASTDVSQRWWAAQGTLASGTSLDIVVNAAGRGALPCLMSMATRGVWWFDHDGHVPWGRGTSGCFEVLEGESVTTSRLLGCQQDDDVTVLRVVRTATHPLFASQNRMEMMWKGIPVLVQKLRELHIRGCASVEDGAAVGPVSDPGETGSHLGPNAIRLSLQAARHSRRAMRYVLLRLFKRERWQLVRGVLESDTSDDAQSMRFRPESIVQPPKGRSWADPHILPDSDGELVMVEEYVNSARRSGRRGRIVLLRIGPSGAVSEARTVLERDGHLSYPCVFRFEDQLFLVPESGAESTVDVFRCRDYPWRWEFVGHAMSGVAAFDSTVFEHQGRWWLFSAVADHSWLTPNDMLYAFSTSDPSHGPWVPHPMNPIVVDARCARPAGPFFRRDGRLYRPGQDCSRGYGSGIRISEVTELTPTRFSERHVDCVEPVWTTEIVATHSLVSSGSTAFVDAMDWVAPELLTSCRLSHAGRR